MQKKYELEDRTKRFSIKVIQFISELKDCSITKVLNYQLLKAGTSIGANYREVNRAESRNDFQHKIAIVQKEASETQYWLELFCETVLGEMQKKEALLQEATELRFITEMRTNQNFTMKNMKNHEV